MINRNIDIRSSSAVRPVSGRIAAIASGVLVGFIAWAVPVHAEDAPKTEHRSVGAFMDDAAVTARVKSGLVANEGLSALAIEVETHEGVVQLSGFVNTQDQIDTAEEIAQRQKGVREVENDLILKEAAE